MKKSGQNFYSTKCIFEHLFTFSHTQYSTTTLQNECIIIRSLILNPFKYKSGDDSLKSHPRTKTINFSNSSKFHINKRKTRSKLLSTKTVKKFCHVEILKQSEYVFGWMWIQVVIQHDAIQLAMESTKWYRNINSALFICKYQNRFVCRFHFDSNRKTTLFSGIQYEVGLKDTQISTYKNSEYLIHPNEHVSKKTNRKQKPLSLCVENTKPGLIKSTIYFEISQRIKQ